MRSLFSCISTRGREKEGKEGKRTDVSSSKAFPDVGEGESSTGLTSLIALLGVGIFFGSSATHGWSRNELGEGRVGRRVGDARRKGR